MIQTKHNWTKEEILAIYNKPMMDLLFEAASIHRVHHNPNVVQGSMLLSIKTGGCPEDCGYCPQSEHHRTGLDREELLTVDQTLAAARRAREHGATRFCMGAAWRNVPQGEPFARVLEMVRG